LGVHPHGTSTLAVARHVGTGQRIVGQSAGLVVRVIVGHGVVVVVVMVLRVRVGRMVMRVMTPVAVEVVRLLLLLEEVVVVVLVVVVVGCGGQRRVEEVVEGVVGHGSGLVRKSISQPW
jgi:hypothetical protein